MIKIRFKPCLCCVFAILFNSIYAFAQTPKRYEIVISELMPDPSPVIGLPNSEFIELKNVSANAVNLRNWKLTDGLSTATITSTYILQPDSFVTVCATSSASSFATFGNVIGVAGFPSLNNDADIISLISPEHKLIHTVNYSREWFNNSVKSEGGWTLEMIDAGNPCGGSSNWKASEDPKGGTPSQRNSVEAINPDVNPPALIRTYSIDSFTVVAVFDEQLDSLSASFATKYSIDYSIGSAIRAIPLAPIFNEVKLEFSKALELNRIYQLRVTEVSDCTGNLIGTFNMAKTGRISLCDSLDLVVNEILFNPTSDATDYVETYNRSNKIFDASRLYIASRNISGAIILSRKISEMPFLIFPGDHISVAEEPSLILRRFDVKNPSLLLSVAELPAFPDDEGEVIILNENGKIVDDLRYTEKWHFALTNDKNGVALERIDPDKATNESSNWTSAASSAGFGTPTSKNSQFKISSAGHSQVSLSSKTFSPDNDGIDDLCFINFQFDVPGYVTNVSVFDITGRIVRRLSSNQTVGQIGYFRWDGMNDLGGKCPTGLYIILTELFDLSGNSRKFKNAVALARKF